MARKLSVSTDVRLRQADGLPITSASVTSGPPLWGTDILTHEAAPKPEINIICYL